MQNLRITRIFDRRTQKEHERIPIKDPLQTGFVYSTSYLFTYGIVINDSDLRNHSHGTICENVLVDIDQQTYKMRIIGNSVVSSQGTGHPELLINDTEFNLFKTIYDLHGNQELRDAIGLKSSDLTNKLN